MVRARFAAARRLLSSSFIPIRVFSDFSTAGTEEIVRTSPKNAHHPYDPNNGVLLLRWAILDGGVICIPLPELRLH